MAAKASEHFGSQEVTAFAVASVFTPPEKRKRGYAQHMMRLLHWVLAPRSALPAAFPPSWGTPPAIPDDLGLGIGQFSVLYSDVGRDFYRACGPSEEPENGWIESGSVQTVYDLPLSATDKVGSHDASTGRWTWLTEEDAKLVWEQDAKWMVPDLASAARSLGRTVFTFLPNQGVGAFTIQRTMKFTPDMTPVLPLNTWGVLLLPQDNATLRSALVENEGKSTTFATWMLDSMTIARTLVVTRIRSTEEAFPHLLLKMLEFARKESISRIEIWALPKELRAHAGKLGWRTEERSEHLSAFKWYGEEEGSKVEWVFNEKFAWC